MDNQNWQRSLFLASGTALLMLGACSGGGGGSSGTTGKVLAEKVTANDTFAQAQPLGLNRNCVGSLTTLGDVDFWSINLNAGNLVRLDLYGSRFDQTPWRTNLTLPRVTVIAPDGTTRLLFHDYIGDIATANAWQFGKHDLDIPAWRVPGTGKYYLRFESDDASVAGGKYAFRVTRLSGGNNTLELEAQGATGVNDTPGTAQALATGNLIGWSEAGEADFYSFTVAATTIANFELTAQRNGAYRNDTSYMEPDLSLYASDGTTLLRTNDDSFFGDPALYQILPAGSYFLEVSSSGGAGDGEYVLRYTSTALGTPFIESESNDTSATADAVTYGTTIAATMEGPADVDFFSFQGQPGEMIRIWAWDESNSSLPLVLDDVVVELIGVNGTTVLPVGGQGEFEVATSILTTTGTHFVRVTPDGTPTATLYHLRIERHLESTFESEPNNTVATFDKLSPKGFSSGIITTLGDVDHFEFSLKKNRMAVISIYAGTVGTFSDGFGEFSGYGSDLRPLILIKNDAGATIASASTGNIVTVSTEGVADGLPTASVAFVAPESGKYYAQVSAAELDNGPAHYYILEVK